MILIAKQVTIEPTSFKNYANNIEPRIGKVGENGHTMKNANKCRFGV